MKKLQDDTLMDKISNKINVFGDQSQLHGVGHVCSTSHNATVKRMFWLFVLVLCGLGTYRILNGALGLYTEDSVSYSVDTNYLTFNTPFPAVTLCERDDYDRVMKYMIAKKHPVSLYAFFKDVFYYNVKYCRTCISCKMNVTCMEHFLDIVNDYRLKCEEMLTHCWWDDKPFNCCERFRPLQTEYGKCFVFNSRLINNESLLYINRQTGLPSLVFTAIQGVVVRIQSPDDEVSTKVENILGQNGAIPLVTEFNATLKVEVTTSDTSIHTLDRKRRDCLLEEEYPDFARLWPFQRYSYSACVLYCRTTMQVDFCNCTHHFMPVLNGIDVCDIQGLACLYKNKDKLQTNHNCGCPMACEEIYYEAIHVTSRRDTSESEKVLARGSRGMVRLNTLPTMRVRRHAFRDMLSFVVDIGGVGGVFFGASLLSVIEIVYLLCIRRKP